MNEGYSIREKCHPIMRISIGVRILFFEDGGRSAGLNTSAHWTSLRSLRSAMTDLKLQRLFVIHPGDAAYALDDTIDVVPLRAVQERFAAPAS